MDERTQGAETPLRRSRRLDKRTHPALPEVAKDGLAVLKEAESEPSDVRAENEEDTHGDEGTGIEVTVTPVEGEQMLQGGDAVLEEGTAPSQVVTSPTEVVTSPTEVVTSPTEVVTSPTEVVTSPTEVVTSPTEVVTSPTGVVTSPTGVVTSPIEVVASQHVLLHDGPSTEQSEEKREHLESAAEPCKRPPLLGVLEPKVKAGSLSNKKELAIPKGKPKSGRIWKDQNKKRFSGMVKDRPLHTSWDKKMAARREKSLMKDFSQRLKDEKQKAKEEKKRRREENLKRRLENERKAEVVQVITNLAKLKRAKKKQLRRIEKRDTLALVQHGSGLKKKAERLVTFLEKKKKVTEAKENIN